MRISSSQSNQWSVGVGLRRSTIYDTNRWMLWANYGFKSSSVSWKLNPSKPTNVAKSKGENRG